MRYLIVLLMLLLMLSGCASPEQIAARQAQEAAQRVAQQEAYRQQVFGQCRAYGFTEGTPEFRQCLMQVDQANQAQNAQMRSIILQQMLQQEYQSMPSCSSLPPGPLTEWRRGQGTCR